MDYKKVAQKANQTRNQLKSVSKEWLREKADGKFSFNSECLSRICKWKKEETLSLPSEEKSVADVHNRSNDIFFSRMWCLLAACLTSHVCHAANRRVIK